MPAASKKQRRFMGADLARKRAGKKTRTDMGESQLEDFAKTKEKGLPMDKRSKKSKKRCRGGLKETDRF
ncbi:MAG: DUF3008 family protein [Candidatus Thorarchaeota archaeon]|jgi:hypothetical protein